MNKLKIRRFNAVAPRMISFISMPSFQIKTSPFLFIRVSFEFYYNFHRLL